MAPDAPLGWWHALEGGIVAGQRPLPPGSGDPYPKVGSVPARPAPTDLLARQRIADSLAAQRDSAEAQAAQDPLPVKPIAAPTPPPPPKVDLNASTATLDAATAAPPPAPPAAPSAAKAAKGAPVLVPASAPAMPEVAIGAVAAPAAPVVSGPLPVVASAPPSLPAVEGYSPPPPPPSAPVAPPLPAPVVNTVQVAFTPGSSVLPPSAFLSLRKFAQAHRGAKLAVLGRGEGGPPDADAQGRALELGLKRAQAIAAQLAESGVPAVNLRIFAEAAGTGGVARLN